MAEPQTTLTAPAVAALKKADEDVPQTPCSFGEYQQKRLVTVFENPSDFNVKHPLQSKWKFWFNGPSKRNNSDNWNASFKEMIVVDTVEDFWGVYNNITNPSQLPENASYFLFRDGVFPGWEDPANKNGGRWQFTISNGQGDVDRAWLHTLLAVIGDNFPENNEIVGAVVSSRRQNTYRIELWTRTKNNEELMKKTSAHWKTTLGVPQENKVIQFKAHA